MRNIDHHNDNIDDNESRNGDNENKNKNDSNNDDNNKNGDISNNDENNNNNNNNNNNDDDDDDDRKEDDNEIGYIKGDNSKYIQKNGRDLATTVDSDLELFIPDSSDLELFIPDIADIADSPNSDKKEKSDNIKKNASRSSKIPNSDIHQETNPDIPIISLAENENILQHSTESGLVPDVDSKFQSGSEVRVSPLIKTESGDIEISGGLRVALSNDSNLDRKERYTVNKNNIDYSGKTSGHPVSSLDVGSRGREGVSVSEAAKKAIEQALLAASQWGGEGEEELDSET